MSGRALILMCLIYAPAIVLAWRSLTGQRRMSAFYCLLVYATFLGPYGTLVGPLTLTVAIALAVVAVEIHLAFTRQRRTWARLKTLDVLILLLVVWVVVISLFRGGPFSGLKGPMVLLATLMLAKFRSDMDEDTLHDISLTLLMGALVVSAVVMVQHGSDDITARGLLTATLPAEVAAQAARRLETIRLGFESSLIMRPTGLQGNPNAASLYILMGLASALANVGWKRRGTRWNVLFIASALIFALAIFYTQSRSALLGAMLMAAVWTGTRLRVPHATQLAAAVGAGLVALLIGPLLIDNISQLLFPTRLDDSLGREELWSVSLATLTDHPWSGRSQLELVTERANFHNDSLHLAVWFGVPAGLLFFGLIGGVLVKAFRTAQREGTRGFGNLCLLMAVGCITHGMFHVLLVTGVCFWLVMGLMINNRRLQAQTAPSRPTPAHVYPRAIAAADRRN